MIPITKLSFGTEEERRVIEVLRSGLIAQGGAVEEFETRFASMHGVSHAIAVNNGTTALVAALQVLDLQPGDEVLTSPFTFAATLNAILESGATATFADITTDDFNLDPASVALSVTDRTTVLLPVHLYGQMANMRPLETLARERGLQILEDSAQSHGASFDGRPAGSYGLAAFSLYATKNITTGEGGVITTNDDEFADALRILRNQGMRSRYEYVVAGHNYRLTDLQAAIGIPQLDRYGETVARRKLNAARLIEGLSDVPGVVVPQELPGRSHVWHQFTIRITEDARLPRAQFAAELAERGVASGVYYPKLLWDYEAYRHHPRVRRIDAPIASQVCKEVLSLPVHNGLTDEDVTQIIAAVRAVAGASA
jgi:dTDP-4-amino-4,6-dideoxygalactose transaminase